MVDSRLLRFIALAVTILYGVGFAVIGDGARTAYAAIGAGLVAIAWIGAGMLGRDEPR